MPLSIAAFAAVAAILVVAPWAVSLSLLMAVGALVAPQCVVFWRFLGRGAKPFSLWATKFSLTILLLAVSLRVLTEAGLLAAPYFIFGVVAGVAFNILLLMRLAHQTSSTEGQE